jgi:hypothetical protein
VWALGAVLYEMIAGEPAISDAGGLVATLQRVLDKDVPPLASRASWVSPALAAVVDAALVRDRAKRVQTAFELVTRLVDAMPDALSQPAIEAPARSTDVSELKPPSSGALPAPSSEPAMTERFTVPSPPPEMAAQEQEPPWSEEGAPSSRDALRVFSRANGLPQELLALRKKEAEEKK